jgi:hypothetical protein
MKKTLLTIAVMSLLLSSCKKPNTSEPIIDLPIVILNEKIMIANEGAFGSGNAELSVIDPTNSTITNNLFKTANNNGALGDVLQSISFKDSSMYCVMNNSGNIKVLNTNNYVLKTTISNLNSPRYISFFDNSAIVTSLAASSEINPLSIINTNTNIVSGTTPMQGWTEGLYRQGAHTYICNYSKSMVYKWNTGSKQNVDSAKMGTGVKEIILYKNTFLVLTDGDYNNPSNKSKIYQIDTSNLNIIDSIQLGTSGYSSINYSASEDKITVLGENKINTVNLSSKQVNTLITGLAGEYFYGFGFDEKYKKYYVCDAKDFSQAGQVIICDKNGVRITSLVAGIAPSKVYFRY